MSYLNEGYFPTFDCRDWSKYVGIYPVWTFQSYGQGQYGGDGEGDGMNEDEWPLDEDGTPNGVANGECYELGHHYRGDGDGDGDGVIYSDKPFVLLTLVPSGGIVTP